MEKDVQQWIAPWMPDRGDGTYQNPILHADYSDPDVIRVGSDFYLVSSSFNCTPGLPILHSKDLVNWTIINHAVGNLPNERYFSVQPGQGIWAPSIRHHAGKFWIVFPTPDEGIYVTTAENPRSSWREPHLLIEGKGCIDPCVFWDDDGQAYIAYAYAGSRAGMRNKIHVRPISSDATRVLGEGRIVASIEETLPALEGPKWHKRNGWYYISAPSGGVQMGWQVIFRSRHVYGPYEEKIVLAQRGTRINGPHQGALVDTPDGDWWFVHFQDADLYGRIVHLQPVVWKNDWPLIGIDQDENGVGKPVLRWYKPTVAGPCRTSAPATSDDFSQSRLGLQWQWQSNHRPEWYSLSETPGKLRLYPQFVLKQNFQNAGNLLLQKFPAPGFEVETEVVIPPGYSHLHAGLIVMGTEFCALDVQHAGGEWNLKLLTSAEVRGNFNLSSDEPLRLRLVVNRGGECLFGITLKDGFYQIGPAFYAKVGKWIGAKFGLYCLSTFVLDTTGHADFSYFAVTGGESSFDCDAQDLDSGTLDRNAELEPSYREVVPAHP